MRIAVVNLRCAKKDCASVAHEISCILWQTSMLLKYADYSGLFVHDIMTLKRTSTPSRDGDVCGGLTIPTRDCHRVVGTPSTDSRVILYVSAILGVWEVGGCDNVHPATLLTWPSTTLKLLSSTPFHYSTFRFLGWDPDGRPFLDMSQRCPTFSMASSNKLATPQRLGQLSAESMGVNRCQQSSFVAAEAEGLAGALQN